MASISYWMKSHLKTQFIEINLMEPFEETGLKGELDLIPY